jgi:hypothetical protein
LLFRAAGDLWYGDVGGAVQDVLTVNGTLTERCPSFGVVVIHVVGIYRRGSNVILQVPEVGQNIGDSLLAKLVDCDG